MRHRPFGAFLIGKYETECWGLDGEMMPYELTKSKCKKKHALNVDTGSTNEVQDNWHLYVMHLCLNGQTKGLTLHSQ